MITSAALAAVERHAAPTAARRSGGPVVAAHDGGGHRSQPRRPDATGPADTGPR